MSNAAAAVRSVNWDPYNQDYYSDPYPTFKRLREEAPVYRNDEYGFHAVSRYEDVASVLGDRDRFISGRGVVLEHIKTNMPVPNGMFIAEDPPAPLRAAF